MLGKELAALAGGIGGLEWWRQVNDHTSISEGRCRRHGNQVASGGGLGGEGEGPSRMSGWVVVYHERMKLDWIVAHLVR